MKVNGIDIRKFNAKQLTVDLQPPKISVNKEWAEGAAAPIEFDTDVTFGTLKLEILFRGSSRNAITRTMSEFTSLFSQSVKMQLDGYKGTYVGFMTQPATTKTRVSNRYIMTLEFDFYMIDAEVVNVYREVQTAKFATLGSRDAPCIIEIEPQTNLQEFTIGGFGDDDITLSNLTRNKKVTINSVNGTVTEDGANKFADCDMWEFPMLKKRTENNITFSSTHCVVTIRYSPMWL